MIGHEDYGFSYKTRFRGAKLRNRDHHNEARLVDRMKLYRYDKGMLKVRKRPKRKGHHGWRTH